MGDTIVGVYYRPPDQEEKVVEALLQRAESSLMIICPGSHGGVQSP